MWNGKRQCANSGKKAERGRTSKTDIGPHLSPREQHNGEKGGIQFCRGVVPAKFGGKQRGK